MRIRRIAPIAVALLSVMAGFQQGHAVGRRLGTAGAAELLIPMGARNIGMAGSNVASIQNTDALYYNPAGLAALGWTELGFAYTGYFADMAVSYFTVGSKLGSTGALGISLQTLSIGEIAVTTIANPEGTGETIKPNYLTLTGSYARAFTDRINIGVTAKLIYEQVSDMRGSALACDLGIQYHSSLGVDLAVVMRNFGTSLRFSGTGIEFDSEVPYANPNATTRKTKLDMASHELPASLVLGASYRYRLSENHALNVSGLYSNNSYTIDQMQTGVEYNLMDKVFLRTGYNLALYPDTYPSGSKESQFGLTFGFGLRVPLAGRSIQFDYAYRDMDLFDAVQCIGMCVQL